MADPTTFPEEHVREPLVYRRISGFAIAAIIVAVCYALIVIIACIAGLSKGMPVLLSPWLQSLAVVGAGLALAGLLHVRRSEDTVAGAKLALWSLLISAFFGLSYGAYYVATYFAIRQQADTFSQRWFNTLKQGKINQAFLLTQDPAVRQHINAEDEDAINMRFQIAAARGMPQKTPLESFRENKLVRLVVQGGPETRITPLGVKDWEYSGGGYRVGRTYRIETEEGTFEAQVTALGSESKTREYEGREWHILTGGTGLNDQPSELSARAQEIANLRLQSGQFVEDWGNKLVSGRLLQAYLDTLEPAERKQQEETFDRRQVLLPVFALTTAAVASPSALPGLLLWIANPDADELARQLFLPGYAAQFPRLGILQADKFRASDVETKDHLLSAIQGIFRPLRTADPRFLGLKPSFGSGYRTWKIDHERVRLPHDCRLSISVDGKLRYSADAVITTESDPGPVTASRRPVWRILSVELLHGEDVRNQRMPGQAAF